MARSLKAAALIFFLILHTKAVFSEVNSKHWEYSKQINIAVLSGKAAAIPLDRQVYDCARADLGDLRIVDASGSEAPYAIISRNEGRGENKLSSSVVNRNAASTESSVLVEVKKADERFNAVRIVPEAGNFAGKVTIEGSNDNIAWQVIRRDIVIYSFSFRMAQRYLREYTGEIYEGYSFGEFSDEKLTLRVPESSFRFVRVSMRYGEDKEPQGFKNVELYNRHIFEPLDDEFKGAVIKVEPDPKAKAMDTTVDLGCKNLPLTRLEISFAGSNFFRRVEVSGSDDLKQWKTLSSDVVFSISIDDEKQEKTAVKLPGEGKRYLKIRVFNGDNNPVKINSVLAFTPKRFLVFIPEKGLSYRLLYGNPGAENVHYDLPRLLSGKDPDDLSRCGLGEQKRNSGYEAYKKPKPWTEDKPYILWTAMAVIMLGLLFLGWKIIGKIDKGEK